MFLKTVSISNSSSFIFKFPPFTWNCRASGTVAGGRNGEFGSSAASSIGMPPCRLSINPKTFSSSLFVNVYSKSSAENLN
jgi:hypothetical protein